VLLSINLPTPHKRNTLQGTLGKRNTAATILNATLATMKATTFTGYM
jgi:hypothetical protein